MLIKISKLSKLVLTAFIAPVVLVLIAMESCTGVNKSVIRPGHTGGAAGRIFGEEVTRAEFERAYRSVYLMHIIMTGQALNIDEQVDAALHDAAWQRLAILSKSRRLGFGAAPEQIIDMITSQPAFQNQQTGQYDANVYNAFVSNFLPSLGMDAKSLETVYAENVIIEKAASAVSQGARVTEEDILEAFHVLNDKITAEYALIPRSLATSAPVTDEQAQAYYNRRADEFRIPEQVIVHYVHFPVENYTNVFTITDDMVRQVYENNKERYRIPDATVSGTSEPQYMPLEEVRGAIRPMITRELARREAFNVADLFVAALAEEGVTFAQQAAADGLQIVSNTPAFSINDTVHGVDPSSSFPTAAFALDSTPTHYYSDPVAGESGVYVIALQKKLPSFLPGFDVVKADVLAAAQVEADEQAYLNRAAEIHVAIQTALEAGNSFSNAVHAQKLKLETTAAYSSSNPFESRHARKIMEATIRAHTGTLVGLVESSGDRLVIFVAQREPADAKTLLPDMREHIAINLRRQKSTELIAAWQKSVVEEAELEDYILAEEDQS